MNEWSTRSQLVYRRSYSRPLNEMATEFETWPQTVARVLRHQAWLWERAKGMNLSNEELAELAELRELILNRAAFPSGRSLWLGGTEVARTRESCNFNCSFTSVKTVFDAVDTLWLLLQGCFVKGTLVGMADGSFKPIELLEAGDLVVSFDELTKSFIHSEVQAVIVNPPKSLVGQSSSVQGIILNKFLIEGLLQIRNLSGSILLVVLLVGLQLVVVYLLILLSNLSILFMPVIMVIIEMVLRSW